MRFTSFLALTLVATLACDSHDHPESYATFQECFDDHTTVESLPVTEAIAICCLEHPIAGVAPVCGATAPACETYLGTNLATTSATPAEVTAGCADYITQRGM
ncbi:MAG: hypothetical protein IPL61_03000 [Myxococcales bacterium]|nr:hypothetical protein [Myxococcales bacterium]